MFSTTRKLILGLLLMSSTSIANAVSINLFGVYQYFTGESGTTVSPVTDGTHSSGLAGATTAMWQWDGTTLNGSGLYSAVWPLLGSPASPALFAEQITDLSINTTTGVASASSFSCIEGGFGSVVGASLCGNYDFGTNFIDESSTSWGPGTAFSQTIGGDDVSNGAPRALSNYSFSHSYVFTYEAEFIPLVTYSQYDWATVVIGNGIALGSSGAEWMCFNSNYAIESQPPGFPGCETAIELAIAPVPVPPALWLFGSALGFAAWWRRLCRRQTS